MIKEQSGAVTLFMTLILMTATLLLVDLQAKQTYITQKTSSNTYRSAQAFNASEAGLEYGIAYLANNKSTIIANPVNGFINYPLSTVTLSNNATYQVVYSNPTANNYTLLTVTSTGKNDDGTSTHVMSQQVYSGSASLKYAITTQQNLTTSGTVTVTGQYGVDVGNTVTQSGNINISSITQHDTALANMTSSALFQSIFAIDTTTMQSQSTYYSSASGVPYSSLSGNVWINSNVTLSGNTTIGSLANPVLLIVNGNFTASGVTTVNGILYVMGGTTVSGTFNLNGGIVSQGSITMSGSSLAYNASIVSRLVSTNYVKLPGSWKDF